MTTITRVDGMVLHVPIGGSGIGDSTHSITHWGVPVLRVHTDAGITGWGYGGTHAHLASDQALVDLAVHSFGPLIVGADVRSVRHIHDVLSRNPPTSWVGRSGLMTLALSLVDIALWDAKAKLSDVPLWQLLGGSRAVEIPVYDTDSGWLSLSIKDMLSGIEARRAEGFEHFKIKVGSDGLQTDAERVRLVRETLGDGGRLMVDANGAWDVATSRRASGFLEEYDVYWLEEPIYFDDVFGHQQVAQATRTPIALGEQLYTAEQFLQFIRFDAAHYLQPDVVRLAGITEWWRVAEMAHAARLPVAPHVGDMMQIHAHLALAHPAVKMLEHIPWLRECFVDPVSVVDGVLGVPEAPGAGSELSECALERWLVYRSGGAHG